MHNALVICPRPGAIKHGFETVGLDEIYCIIYPENTRSIRVAERLGLEPLGTTKQYHDQELLFYKTTDHDYAPHT